MHLSLDCAARAANVALAEGFRGIPVTSVATDSRKAVPGTLFVCIPGERVDGHDFAESAAAKGACAVLAQHPLPAFAARRPDVPVLVVEDSVKTLGQVAHAWRRTFAGKVVGLTGTAGKTTVKEWDDQARLLAECEAAWPEVRALAKPMLHRYELVRKDYTK